MDSNCWFLVSEATTLPTKAQQVPLFHFFLCNIWLEVKMKWQRAIEWNKNDFLSTSKIVVGHFRLWVMYDFLFHTFFSQHYPETLLHKSLSFISLQKLMEGDHLSSPRVHFITSGRITRAMRALKGWYFGCQNRYG